MPASDDLPWDGRGLPPAANERLRRAAASGVAGSLLSVPDAAALAAVGFEPVGEAMGCIVQHLGWRGYGCGYVYGWNDARTVTSSTTNRWAGFAPYVKALNHAWDTALGRMLAEASALGADGVVGVRLATTSLDAANREFLALGTAVRGRTPTRARQPFATELSGADLGKLLHAGWVPSGIAIGVSVGVRHDDYRTRRQTMRWQANTEVDGYTELVTSVRRDARRQFERRVRALGGEAVLVSRMDLQVWANEVGEDHQDHYAEALVTGTTATGFHTPASTPTSTLTILPLGPAKENRR